jgi:hypothetical protein
VYALCNEDVRCALTDTPNGQTAALFPPLPGDGDGRVRAGRGVPPPTGQDDGGSGDVSARKQKKDNFLQKQVRETARCYHTAKLNVTLSN